MSEAGLSTLFWSIPREDAKYLSVLGIIDLIHFTPDRISHIELTTQINLLRAVIAAIINDLSAVGLVNEVED